MCEPPSMMDHVAAQGLVVENPRHVAVIRDGYTVTLPYPSLPLSVPLHERLAEIDRVRDENLARIERQKDENIAAIDRNYALVDEALGIGLPDMTYWLWVAGLGAVASIVYLLRMVP